MSHIHINYDEVRSVAKEFEEKSQATQDIINTMNGKVEQVMANWEGIAEQSFIQEFESCRSRMGRIPGKLNQIARALRETADRIQQAEEEAARQAQEQINADW